MAIQEGPPNPERRRFLKKGLEVAVIASSGALVGAVLQRLRESTSGKTAAEILDFSTFTPEDIAKIETLIRDGHFTEIPRSYAVRGERYQSYTATWTREGIDELIVGLENYDKNADMNRLQHLVVDSPLYDRNDLLYPGVNYLVSPYSDRGQFRIASENVRVYARTVGGTASYTLISTEDEPQGVFKGLYLNVDVGREGPSETRPDIKPIVILLPR